MGPSANRGQSGSAASRSRACLFEGSGKIVAQNVERAFDARRAADHDFARELAEAALHPVSNDRPADFLADGETDALRWVTVRAIADEEDESRSRRAPSGVRSEKVRAFPKCD
jgi:hypothetical protein